MTATWTERPPASPRSRKSVSHPSAVDAAIDAAVAAVAGIDRWLPVLHAGRMVALVRGYAAPSKLRASVALPPPGIGLSDLPLSCAFTNYDSIINALGTGARIDLPWAYNPSTAPVSGNWYDLWPVGGSVASGPYSGAARASVAFTSSTTGSLPVPSVSPQTIQILNFLAITTASSPVVMLYDRVLTYEACTLTTGNQSFTNSVPAGRYVSAGQPGLKVLVTGQTLLGATTTNFSQLQYTNQAGTALQSVPGTPGLISSAATPTTTLGARVICPRSGAATTTIGAFLPLATGDTGVQLLSNYTCSANNTGTLAFVLGAPLAMIPVQSSTAPMFMDLVTQVASLPVVQNNACLSMLFFASTATGLALSGNLTLAWS